MQDKNKDLSKYRLQNAKETVAVARECFEHKHYRDSINRSYYAAFYATKAVLAVEGIDFKRHKDVVAYFNKEYVATGRVAKEVGRALSRLQKCREQSDYDDFFIASVEEASQQLDGAEMIISAIEVYITSQD